MDAAAVERSDCIMKDAETNQIVRTVASTQSEMTEIILPNDNQTRWATCWAGG